MEIHRFTDGPTRHQTWVLPDSGWNDWEAASDRFLAQALREIAAELESDAPGSARGEWLEINYWQDSGRLIVFPSREGPYGDRDEPVCFELSSAHLDQASRQIGSSVPQADQEAAWRALFVRVWRRIAESLANGAASRELTTARRSFPLRIAAYDYEPGEKPWRLSETGEFIE